MQEHESEGGRTPLMKACRAGHLCTVQFLVLKSADINRRTTNNDHTPLSLACAGGHLAIVQFLLDRGANMFHKLKVRENFSFEKWFYEKFNEHFTCVSQDNSTMLIEAAKGGHTNVVQLLLDYPERCGSTVDNNLNLAASPTTAVPATTATATQTCSVPTACVSPETSKMLTPASMFSTWNRRKTSFEITLAGISFLVGCWKIWSQKQWKSGFTNWNSCDEAKISFF